MPRSSVRRKTSEQIVQRFIKWSRKIILSLDVKKDDDGKMKVAVGCTICTLSKKGEHQKALLLENTYASDQH